MLGRITRAPLKPQQRLTLLKMFLIPRYTHRRMFGRATYGILRGVDREVRKSVRKCLCLPDDVPTPFFHARVAEGDLGIMSFETKIPEMIAARLSALSGSDFGAASVVPEHDWERFRLRWCKITRFKNEQWAKRLYDMVDGHELREAGPSGLSTSWINDPFITIPARKYVQNVRTRIGALPTRLRTTRGNRRMDQSVLCRAA